MTYRLFLLSTVLFLSVGLLAAHDGNKKKTSATATKASCCMTEGVKASAKLPLGHPEIEKASSTHSKVVMTKVSTTGKEDTECTEAEIANCDETTAGNASVKKAGLKMDCCKDSKTSEVKAQNSDSKKETPSNPDGGTN